MGQNESPSSPLTRAAAALHNAPLPLAGGVGGGQPKAGHFKSRDTARARDLRNQATPAERVLWRALSNRKLNGHKFSRQMPIGPYFADFMCRAAKLIVELDGVSHDMRQDYDARRDSFIAEQGFVVRRFTNEDVMGNLDGVVEAVASALAERCPPLAPPASGRGELGDGPPASGRGEEGSEFPSRLREGLGVGASGTEPLLGISLEGSVG